MYNVRSEYLGYKVASLRYKLKEYKLPLKLSKTWLALCGKSLVFWAWKKLQELSLWTCLCVGVCVCELACACVCVCICVCVCVLVFVCVWGICKWLKSKYKYHFFYWLQFIPKRKLHFILLFGKISYTASGLSHFFVFSHH